MTVSRGTSQTERVPLDEGSEGGVREIDVKGRCKKKNKKDEAGVSRGPLRVEVTVCLPGAARHGTAELSAEVTAAHACFIFSFLSSS